MYQAYDALYGDKADLYALGGLLGMVNAVLQGCAEDQFQQLVANNPEITLEESFPARIRVIVDETEMAPELSLIHISPSRSCGA